MYAPFVTLLHNTSLIAHLNGSIEVEYRILFKKLAD